MTCPRCSAPDPWVAAFDSCSRCCPPREQQLISKKTAKELYLLTDGDLKGLGSLLRANPHGATLAPMRLFLESQVKAVAAERHGVSVAGSGGGAGGASTSGRSGHHNDDEEEEYDDFGEEDLDGGFLKPPQKPKDALEARLEAARLERLERRLSTRAARRAADASREATAAAKLARARAAVEERSRLELDEGQKKKKKSRREEEKDKKRKRKKGKKGGDDESESSGEEESSDDDGKDDDDDDDGDTGVEVETI